MNLIISLIIGIVAGWFVNYAITFQSGQIRNFGLAIAGAVIGGALVPVLLGCSGTLIAVVGSVVGAGVLFVIYFLMTLKSSGSSS